CCIGHAGVLRTKSARTPQPNSIDTFSVSLYSKRPNSAKIVDFLLLSLITPFSTPLFGVILVDKGDIVNLFVVVKGKNCEL
ncbi:MAG: hypothetical protein IJF63_03165, partial [Alistipes sp.]|nr:hypothetical protein [Alistipes sp.]